MFEKFKNMLKQLQVSLSFHEILVLIPKFAKFMQALLKGGKQKLTQEHINMVEKEEAGESLEVPTKMNDPREFNITYTIGGMKITHALCDLGSNINVMPLRKFMELEIGEIVPSNMTLTLADSSVTCLLGVVQDVLIHVDGLTFPKKFVIIDMKNDSKGSVILERSFLETGNAKIDVETNELILKFNKEKVVFHAYQWTMFVDDLETHYQLKDKGSEDHKRMKVRVFTSVRVFLAPGVFRALSVKLLT